MRLRTSNLSRAVVLGTLVALGAASIGLVSAQQGEMEVTTFEVADNLHVLRGGGGNSAAYITSNGVVLVDTKLAGWGQPLIDAIGELTSNPITTIINTHTHFDHVSGNVEFPASVEVIVHENTERLMGEWNGVTGLGNAPPNVFEANNGAGMPDRTFTDTLTIGSGNDQVDLHFFGCGHTGGDTWVVFPAVRAMHAGDMFPGKQIPIMDKNNGGCGVDYATTLRLAHATVTDVDTIITGHSGQMTREDLSQMADFVSSFVGAVKLAKERGQTAAQFAESWVPAPRFRPDFTVPPPARLQAYVQVIYDEIDAM